MTAIKFCGLMRVADVEVAVELGASFLGAVFAGGPRLVSPAHAHALFDGVTTARRVGVFGDQPTDEIARIAEAASLDVVQLHADPTSEKVEAVKAATGLETWPAMRIAKRVSEAELDALISSADAILFDTRADGALGGTGRTFDWEILTDLLDQYRRSKVRIVLAGGLTPALAAPAIEALRPDIVDVSSGVETSPGIKDHALMRAFAAAVRRAS